ncbi:MAG: long-chain fatty acid--CoA ligase [Acidimicrobiaceae bacterium]|nr:long-chain fatty acid--CoA ligase [Acidimicrobiaceae bacterium]MEC9057966.1 AMP-binding protein [Actinomycetota bacterium]MEE3255794.1 AMP-binding protein [Actinomycetota bacterium]
MNTWQRHLPKGLEASKVDLLAGETLPRIWVDQWRQHPQRDVIYDPKQGWVKSETLLTQSEVVAKRLAHAGVGPGDRVLLSASTSVELVTAHVASLRLGAVVIPTNGAYRSEEVAHVVSDARPTAAIVEQPEWQEWIRATDPKVVVTSPLVELEEGPSVSLDEAGTDSPALIGYTSGTTGRPKGAVLTHGNLLSSVRGLEIAWRWTSDDILILALPLFHMHGLGVGLHGSLTVGAQVVLLSEFDVDEVLNSINKFQATMFFGVPTMYGRLLDSENVSQLGQLRLCVSGSAPLSAEVHQKIYDATGQQILERYGMTETAMLVSNPYQGERRPNSVGFPLPGVEVRLEGSPAEIQVKGPNVFKGYWERPDENRASFDDGWFCTGDLGVVDSDGYLSISGRAKELIISGGFNVYPKEVEDVVSQHEAVQECAVVGVPDAQWGEAVVAFVVADREIDSNELKNFVGERLAHYKRPQQTHRVDSLPRNALGKVQKHRLIEEPRT